MTRRTSSRGMAAVSRRTLVAGLFLRGVTDPTEIASRLRMPRGSEQVVLNDLEVIQRQYSEITAADADAMRHLMAAKLDAVEAASWQAWEESKRRRVVKEKRRALPAEGRGEESPSPPIASGVPAGEASLRSIQTGDPEDDILVPAPEPAEPPAEILLPLSEQEITSESLAGNPAYLAAVRDCIAQRRQMFNLDIPRPEEEDRPHTVTNHINITIEQFNALPMSERLRLVRSGSVNLDEPPVQPAGVSLNDSNPHVPHPIPHSAGSDTGRVLSSDNAPCEPGTPPAP